MSVDKMVEKTKQVLDKQRELNNLIIDMKEEVRAVQQENKALKQKILELQGHVSPQVEHVLTQEQQPVTPQINEQESQPVKHDSVQAVQEEQTEQPIEAPVSTPQPVQQQRKAPSAPKPILEFFLGKNVIVKIAAILMVLAIITFGQIAYVDWLNNIGRFLLIAGIGIFFTGLGYFFETKKADMYAHIFYIIGLSVLVADTYLGQFEYQLYENVVQLIMLVVLTGLPLYYFRKSRAAFLDTFMIPYYVFLLISPIILAESSAVDGATFIFMLLLIGSAGYAVYRHFIDYVKRGAPLVYIDIFVLTIGIVWMSLGAGALVSSNSFSLGHVLVLLYQVSLIALLYVINIKRLDDRPFSVQLAILMMTTVGFLVLGISLNGTYRDLTDLTNLTLQTLFMSILLLPIYIYLFVKNSDTTTRVRNTYLIVFSIVTLLYTFIMQNSINYLTFNFVTREMRAIDLDIKNIILVIETALLFCASLLTKDKAQKYVSYGFMGAMLAVYFFEFGIQWNFGFDSTSIFLPSILGALVMYGLHMYFDKENTDPFDRDILTVLVTISAIPLFNAISKDLLIDKYPIHLTSIVLWLIGVRYLTSLKRFQTKYQEQRKFITNIVLVFLVFIGNFYYLNHDFTTFNDLFFAFYVLLANIYMIQALREIYHYIKSNMDINAEHWFIGLYVLGVGIQAVYVTQYINFSFDKVILSSYYMIAAAVGILWGFRYNWFLVRKIGLFAIYFSLAKFFVYDFWANDFDLYVRFLSYFILALVLFGISALYSYLEKTYGTEEIEEQKNQ